MTDEEIRDALFQMSPCKAPGWVSGWFLPAILGDIVKQVCDYVRGVFQTGVVEEWSDGTILVLIPKKDSPQFFSENGPISLFTVLYKIITKVIANRLKGIMSDLVLPNHTSFVPGRHITYNILIAQEIMHSMWVRKGRRR